MSSGNEVYKRGQVEWAIWRFFTLTRAARSIPPKVFLTRIKRLLETDRHDRVPAGEGSAPPAAFAFSTEQSEGKGVDALFTSFDAFCLALALDLVDLGFKPSETVFLLRYLRPELEQQHQGVMRNPPPPVRQRQLRRDRPNLPDYQADGKDWADGRVFWVIQKVELKEIYREPPRRPRKTDMPLFLDPKFCRGIRALSEELGEMNHERWGYRKALVLEIAYLADGLGRLLQAAPVMKRGRQ